MAGKGPGYLQSRAALRDGAIRAGTHFDAEVSAEPAADLGAELMAWAQNHQLKRVVAYRPFVGPWLTESLAVEAALAAAGICLFWFSANSRSGEWDSARAAAG